MLYLTCLFQTLQSSCWFLFIKARKDTVRVCQPGCPWQLPENLKKLGVVLQRTGENEGLVRYFLQHCDGIGVNKADLTSLWKDLALLTKVKVTRHGEKKVGNKSRLLLVCAIE